MADHESTIVTSSAQKAIARLREERDAAREEVRRLRIVIEELCSSHRIDHKGKG